MRKPFLLLGIASLTLASAVAETPAMTPTSNPWVINQVNRIENPLCPQALNENSEAVGTPTFATKRNSPFRVEGEEPGYFVAAQRYFKGYTFVYGGGDISTYNMNVTVDGENVTIKGLMNLAAQSSEWALAEDYDIVGTYDAEAHTLTIPTLTNFEDATIAGITNGGYYQEMLIAGTVSETGQIDTVDELVFDVIGDFEALTTSTSFGVMNCSSEGAMFGMGELYRGFYATLPQSEPKLISFGDKVNVGEQFATMQLENTFTVVNVSDVEVNYFAEIESDGNVLSLPEEIGTVDPLSTLDINILFSPIEPGNYTAELIVEYESDAADAEPLSVTVEGTAVAMPDYNKIVKNGDFTFQTNIDYPFVLETLSNGTEVAISTCGGIYYNLSSKLRVEFEVPENNLAILSWKGDISIDQMYNAAAGYFIDDSDVPAVTIMESDDFSGSIEFGPGKHSILYQYENYNRTGSPDYFMYLYDLNLDLREAADEEVRVENPDITLPNQLIKDDLGIVTSGIVEVRNMGKTPLSISSITLSDPDNFSADVPKGDATLFEVLTVNVNFTTKEIGEYSTKVDIITNCGNVSAEIKVLVRKMADFSSVIVDGMEYVTSIETSDTDPFDVVDGVAFNANTGMDDSESTTSWFQINFEIPEGVNATIEWNGEILSSEFDLNDPLNRMDYGIIDVYNSNNGRWTSYTNEYGPEISSFYFDEIGFGPALEFVGPASGYVNFSYFKNGDGVNNNEDVMRISDFSIVADRTGINAVNDVVTLSTEVFSVNGMRMANVQKGINILRTTYSDGSVKTRKVVVR